MKGLKSHRIKFPMENIEINDSYKYRTLCGRIVSIWAVMYLNYWWCICKTCRKIYKSTPT